MPGLPHAAVAGLVLVLVLVAAASGSASDTTLRAALNGWSKKIGADARAITRDARLGLPSHMIVDAIRFRKGALQARAAVANQKPSTAKGSRARRLALAALSNFAAAGSDWAASGRARVDHQRASSIESAQAGTQHAHTGNLLLVAAGKLLRR